MDNDLDTNLDTPEVSSPAASTSPAAGSSYTGGEFGSTKVNFKKYLRYLRENNKRAELEARSLCPQCRQPPGAPWVTSCNHVYCGECLEAVVYEAARDKREKASCKECGVIFTSSERASGLEELGFEGSSPMSETRRKRKESNPDRDVLKWIDIEGHILPSAKTLAIKAQILNWREDAPKEKIIISTQFHEM